MKITNRNMEPSNDNKLIIYFLELKEDKVTQLPHHTQPICIIYPKSHHDSLSKRLKRHFVTCRI